MENPEGPFEDKQHHLTDHVNKNGGNYWNF